MRMTKAQKMQRNIDRLAAEFGVPTLPVSIGTAGYMLNGFYQRDKIVFTCPNGPGSKPVPSHVAIAPHIVLDHKLTNMTIMETMAHEFAHHLAHEWGLSCVGDNNHDNLFWIVLQQVRKAILPSSDGTATLEYSTLDRIHASWK
jgi:hypothetical protein